MFVINMVILTVWQVLSPLKYVRSYELHNSVDRFGRRNSSDSRCISDNGLDTYFFAFLFFMNGSMIVVANVQAFRARNISTEFSESKYILIAMVIILQALFISLPVWFYTTNAKANFTAKGALLLLVGAAILYSVFLPKIYFAHRYTRLKQRRDKKRSMRMDRAEARWEQVAMALSGDQDDSSEEEAEPPVRSTKSNTSERSTRQPRVRDPSDNSSGMRISASSHHQPSGQSMGEIYPIIETGEEPSDASLVVTSGTQSLGDRLAI